MKTIVTNLVLTLYFFSIPVVSGFAAEVPLPASLPGHFVFIGQVGASKDPLKTGAYPPLVSRAYLLKPGAGGGAPQLLTPQDETVWHLIWDDATGKLYYYGITEKTNNHWFVLKPLDAASIPAEAPHSLDLDAYEIFSISPDGRYMAGVRKECWDGLCITDLSEKSPPRKIAGQSAYNFRSAPQLSPDDSKIVFAGGLKGDPNYTELFTVDSDGSHMRQVTDYPSWVSWWVRLFMPGPEPHRWDRHWTNDPRWSPDGKWILFTSIKGIYRMRADGSMQQLIVPDARWPSWSPDGQMIAYVARRNGASAHDPVTCADLGFPPSNIYVSRPDGTGEMRVTDDASTLEYLDLHWIK